MIKLCWTCTSLSNNPGGDLQASDLLRAVSETTSNLILVKDREGRLLFANRAAIQLLGKPAPDLIGHTELEFLTDAAQAERLLSSDRRVVESGVAEEVEETFSGPDGERTFLFRKAPLEGQNGGVAGVVSVAWDITERKQTEERLRHLIEERDRILQTERQARSKLQKADELKDQFLAVVSHELRTPLTAIIAWAHLLLSGRCPEAKKSEIYRTLLNSAEAQSHIVNDLLDMSRLARGGLRIAPRPVALRPIIESSIETIQTAATAKDITLTVEGHDNPVVTADPVRMHQILWNLLSNAMKFTPVGGSVSVHFHAHDGFASLSVIDNGEGVPAEFLPFMFDRFRQADSSSTRVHNGLGLGLSLVRSLVEIHGGEVNAASAGPGCGTTITVTMPLATADECQSQAGDRPANNGEFTAETIRPALQDLRVLVIDDEPTNLAVVRAVLESANAEVMTARSAEEGFRLFLRGKPDILICDIGLPGEDGYALIRRIRSLSPRQGGIVTAVAVTAYTEDADREAALKAGFQSHLPKPFTPGTLIGTICNVLGRGQPDASPVAFAPTSLMQGELRVE